MKLVKAAWLVVVVYGLLSLGGLYVKYTDHQRFLTTEMGACFEKCVDNGLPPRFPVQSSPCVCSVPNGSVPWVNLSNFSVDE